MHDNHLHGLSRRRGGFATTERNPRQRPVPDLVECQFVASDINLLWVADMTYVPTWEEFLYRGYSVKCVPPRHTVVATAHGRRGAMPGKCVSPRHTVASKVDDLRQAGA